MSRKILVTLDLNPEWTQLCQDGKVYQIICEIESLSQWGLCVSAEEAK